MPEPNEEEIDIGLFAISGIREILDKLEAKLRAKKLRSIRRRYRRCSPSINVCTYKNWPDEFKN